MANATCLIEGCEGKHHCRGWCRMHYNRWKRHGDPLTRKYKTGARLPNNPACVIDGCEKPWETRQMCPMHYQRWRKTGDANTEPHKWPTVCSVEGCSKAHYGKALCIVHFTKLRRYGSATFRLPGNIVDGKKICSKCRRDLPVEMYRPRRSDCRTCTKTYAHARRALLASVESDDYKAHEIFERDGWVCQLCFLPMDESVAWPAKLSPSVDHIIPISRGGTDTLNNVQSAHLTCNISKGTRLIT